MSAPRTWRMSCARLEGLLVAGRARSGLTQAEVADLVGVSLPTFKRFELGLAEPRLRQMFRWADAVGVTITADAVADGGIKTDTFATDPAPLRHLAAPALAAFHHGEHGPAAASCHVNPASAHSPAGHA